MVKTLLYNLKGEKVREIELPSYIFEEAWNPDLVHQIVEGYRANKRRGTAHTKDRSEVRGGGRKPWRQKGTGRARHGSIRSPIWRGGGVTFGPRKEKNYKHVLPKKMRRKALFSALSKKLKDKEILFLQDFEIKEPRTKEFLKVWRPFVKSLSFLQHGRVRIVLPGYNKSFLLATRNLDDLDVFEAKDLNALEVLLPRYLVFLESSLQTLKEVFKPVNKRSS